MLIQDTCRETSSLYVSFGLADANARTRCVLLTLRSHRLQPPSYVKHVVCVLDGAGVPVDSACAYALHNVAGQKLVRSCFNSYELEIHNQAADINKTEGYFLLPPNPIFNAKLFLLWCQVIPTAADLLYIYELASFLRFRKKNTKEKTAPHSLFDRSLFIVLYG